MLHLRFTRRDIDPSDFQSSRKADGENYCFRPGSFAELLKSAEELRIKIEIVLGYQSPNPDRTMEFMAEIVIASTSSDENDKGILPGIERRQCESNVSFSTSPRDLDYG